MQNQSLSDEYKVKYAPFDFLSKPGIAPYHIALDTPSLYEIDELHYHDAIEIGYCYKGSGIFIIDGEIISFSAPCATLIYPGQLHKAKSTGSTSVWKFATFCPEILIPEFSDFSFSKLVPKEQDNLSLNLFKNNSLFFLIREIINEIDLHEENFMNSIKGLLQSIVVKHSRLFYKQSESQSQRSNMHRLGPIINYISQNYKNNLSVKQLSLMFNISEASLRRWFQESLNLSPLQYLHKVRITAASCLLMNTDLSVLEIAMQVGYNSQSSFQRQFTSEYGCSPTAYVSKTLQDN